MFFFRSRKMFLVSTKECSSRVHKMFLVSTTECSSRVHKMFFTRPQHVFASFLQSPAHLKVKLNSWLLMDNTAFLFLNYSSQILGGHSYVCRNKKNASKKKKHTQWQAKYIFLLFLRADEGTNEFLHWTVHVFVVRFVKEWVIMFGVPVT